MSSETPGVMEFSATEQYNAIVEYEKNKVMDPTIPSYYQGKGNFQAWDLIEAFGIGYNLGCAIKYITRAGKKTPDPTVDLRKAIRMIERELECHAKR